MPTPAGALVEVAVETPGGARAAQAAGAARLELCTGLLEGGLTPSAGLIAQVSESVALPLFVLIRPRPGDFLYDAGELAVMVRDIAEAARRGADGVVVGALDQQGEVDRITMHTLVEAARPLAVTFHRAFDLAANAERSLETLMALGVERVLTSGQAPTAEAGLPMLRRLVTLAGDRLTIVAGGGVTAAGAPRLVREAGIREVHLSGRTTRESPMAFRRDDLRLGGPVVPGEYERYETDPIRIRAVVEAVSSGSRTVPDT
jgi:copper homeostasis protein